MVITLLIFVGLGFGVYKILTMPLDPRIAYIHEAQMRLMLHVVAEADQALRSSSEDAAPRVMRDVTPREDQLGRPSLLIETGRQP